MEYTIQKLGKLAGVSTRTLRYYDEIDLLKPSRINSSGYRIYGEDEINKLQLILFYRELEVPLETIKTIINAPNFNTIEALTDHILKLLQKRERLTQLIDNIQLTISSLKGEYKMSNDEKFKAFKEKILTDNENKYGKEIRSKYGDTTIDESNKKFSNMSKEQYDSFTKLGSDINSKLKEAMATNDVSSPLAQEVAKLHKEWLSYTWNSYSKEAHAGLAQMYVYDERFTKYYEDNAAPGAAVFLRDCILAYLKI